jgi:DNA-binding NarL/FixJ family response regulator
MKTNGPIIIVDDDDHHVANIVIKELMPTNKLLTFTNCIQCLEYLVHHEQEHPFIIFSDINIPKMNGIDSKKEIEKNETLRKKCIPFVYYSTSASPGLVEKAFEMQVQGFFVKKNSVEETKALFKTIFDYWTESKHPQG